MLGSDDFTPKSTEGAGRLNELLGEYCQRRGAPLLPHLSLATVSVFVHGHPESGRIFDYCVEVQIQTAILQIDLAQISQALRLPDDTPLSDQDTFCHRMDVLRMNSGFIFRYRAIWDKIMSILVLLVAPAEFKQFDKTGSRKSRFQRIARGNRMLPDALVAHVIATTKDFDSRFRTPEAHGSGSARRWVTGELETWDSTQGDMFWASNQLNLILHSLGAVFRHAPPSVWPVGTTTSKARAGRRPPSP